MNSLKNRSQKVEQEPTAQANNYDVPTSSVEEEAARDIGGGGKTHGFSKRVAEYKSGPKEKIGWAGSLVLRFLSHLQRRHGRLIGDKKWIRINLDNISAQYPYLGRSTVDEAIVRMKKAGACLVANQNRAFGKRKCDRTNCFHIPRKWMDLAEEELRYFDAGFASEVGVPAAVIHFNFLFWITKVRGKGETPIVKLAPASLVELLPFSKSVIKRAIKDLIDRKWIHPVSGMACCYSDESVGGSKADETGSNPDMGGSKADKGGSNPDNHSIGSNIVGSLEANSKGQRAAGLWNSSPCVEDAHTSQENDLMPSADEQDTGEGISTELSPPAAVSSSPFPDISDFAELHRINRAQAQQIVDGIDCSDTENQLTRLISNLSDRFFHSMDADLLLDHYGTSAEHAVYCTFSPMFRDWFATLHFPEDSTLLSLAYCGTLECVLGAILRPQLGDTLLHPVRMLRPISYNIHLELLRRAESRRENDLAIEFAERRADYRSIDQDSEYDDQLPPAQKARVFKQGLHAMNRVGWICLGGTLQTDGIQITKDALVRIEALFRQNELLTPVMLLEVMHKCVAIHAEMPPPPSQFRRGCRWHARMAHHVPVFARYLPTMLRQLNIDCPALGAALVSSEEEYEEAA